MVLLDHKGQVSLAVIGQGKRERAIDISGWPPEYSYRVTCAWHNDWRNGLGGFGKAFRDHRRRRSSCLLRASSRRLRPNNGGPTGNCYPDFEKSRTRIVAASPSDVGRSSQQQLTCGIGWIRRIALGPPIEAVDPASLQPRLLSRSRDQVSSAGFRRNNSFRRRSHFL